MDWWPAVELALEPVAKLVWAVPCSDEDPAEVVVPIDVYVESRVREVRPRSGSASLPPPEGLVVRPMADSSCKSLILLLRHCMKDPRRSSLARECVSVCSHTNDDCSTLVD